MSENIFIPDSVEWSLNPELTENRSDSINRHRLVRRHQIIQDHPADLEDVILLVSGRVVCGRSDYHNLPVLRVLLSQRQEDPECQQLRQLGQVRITRVEPLHAFGALSVKAKSGA